METLDEKNSGGMSEKAFHDITGTAGWLKITGMVFMAISAIGVLFTLYSILTIGVHGILLVALLLNAAILAWFYLVLKQGNSLASFGTGKSSTDLDEFAKNFKTYWTIYGIVAILCAVVYVILLLLSFSNGGRMF